MSDAPRFLQGPEQAAWRHQLRCWATAVAQMCIALREDGAGRDAKGERLQADAVRRHRRFQPAGLYLRLAFGRHKALPALVSGLTLHAAVRCAADDQQALEQLCRDITRPPCRPRRTRGPAPRQAQTVHRTVCVRARPECQCARRQRRHRCARVSARRQPPVRAGKPARWRAAQ